jgi:hypothetical protein
MKSCHKKKKKKTNDQYPWLSQDDRGDTFSPSIGLIFQQYYPPRYSKARTLTPWSEIETLEINKQDNYQLQVMIIT